MLTPTPAILVTGATGFLGSYILRYLHAYGYTRLYAIKRANSSLALVADIADKVTWIETDVLDVVLLEQAMQGIDEVYHAAAMVSFDAADSEAIFKANIQGTANVVNMALAAGVKKLLFVSSVAALGRTKDGLPIHEKTAWENTPYNSKYAISKYQAELEAWRGAAEGLSVAVINPSIILGSGFWSSSSVALFQQVWKGLTFYPVGGHAFVDVRDVARFAIRLMQTHTMGQRYIVSAENWSFHRLFSTIAAAIGKSAPTIRTAPWLATVVALIEGWRTQLFGGTPLVTRETAQTSSHVYTYAHQKSLQAFPDFQYTPIEQTIRETGAQLVASKAAGQAYATLPLVFPERGHIKRE